MYSIIDIETTGGAGRQDKITEIAIFVHDGEKVVDEFISLVNPECTIPPNITEITGINNAMVDSAPKFYEIAKRIVEITEGTIFVAHSVNFDYSFVKNEFKRLGFNYNRKRLCTVKLARKYLPGHKSYSLGKICPELGIEINGRHRAGGDAAATVELFEMILEKNGNHILSDNKQWVVNLPDNLERSVVETLPEGTGVYYFYNQEKELIYVGKSTNIYSRILSHLGNVTSKKAIEMKENIADISFEETGSELIALLFESDEIKSNKPFYNVAQRRTRFLWGVNTFYDLDGYLNFEIIKNSKDSEVNLSFTSKLEARKFIERLIDEYGLCPKLSGVYESSSHCFNYLVNKCKGACVKEQSADQYNLLAEGVVNNFKYFSENFVIFDEGRVDGEDAIIVIQEGRYRGYGYLEEGTPIHSIEELLGRLILKEENKDTRKIINGYLSKKKNLKIVRF